MMGRELIEKDIYHILLDEETIRRRVEDLGTQLSEDYQGKDVILLCILKGAVIFFADLVRAMTIHVNMDFMAISSYGDAVKTSGIVKIAKGLDSSITGKPVIIAEAIMDSGLTLSPL